MEYKEEKQEQINLFEMKEWWQDEWQGMPEFIQEDKTPWHTLYVHFKSRQDLESFAELVKQKINKRTKFIWFPLKERICRFGKMYFDES